MLSDRVLEDLWTGAIAALGAMAHRPVVKVLREAFPIQITFLATPDPNGQVYVYLDGEEVEEGLTLGDAVAEETGVTPAMGSVIVLAPEALLHATEPRAMSRAVGRIAGELLLAVRREVSVPLQLENTMLFHLAAMCRRASRGPQARAAGISSVEFARAMGGVLADYWGHDHLAPFSGKTFWHSTKFVRYMRNLDPYFDDRARIAWSPEVTGTGQPVPFYLWARHIAADVRAADASRTPAAPAHA